MLTFAHAGLELSYRVSGDGLPFVFQHGLGGDATQPAAQVPEGCMLVTLECRGHGRSPLGPDAALGFATFAADLGALVDALALPALLLGGISMGAGVALSLARQRPEQVLGLVLVRPAWVDGPGPANLHAFHEIAALLRRHGAAAGKERFQSTSTYQRLAATSPAAARSLVAQFDRPSARAHAAVLERLVADRPLGAEDWDALTMPALVIGAAGDEVHPLHAAAAVARRLPAGRLREVPSKDAGEPAHRRAVATAIAGFAADVTREPVGRG